MTVYNCNFSLQGTYNTHKHTYIYNICVGQIINIEMYFIKFSVLYLRAMVLNILY